MTNTAPLLILTSTIDPQGMAHLAISDVSRRREQYLSSVRYWLLADPRWVPAVVLVENSGSDLSAFEQLSKSENPHGKPCEFISLTANNFPKDFGKGYGEFSMLDQAIAKSKLVATHAYFAKITGRLLITNLAAIIRRLPHVFDFCADAHLLPDPPGGLTDSRLMFFNTSFYQQRAVGLFAEMNDSAGIFAEHKFFELMQRNPTANLISRLPAQPVWMGFSASTGADYGSMLEKLKNPLRMLRRRMQILRGYPSIRQIIDAPRPENRSTKVD